MRAATEGRLCNPPRRALAGTQWSEVTPPGRGRGTLESASTPALGAQPSVVTWLPFNSEDGQLLQQSLFPAELPPPNGVAQPPDWSGQRRQRRCAARARGAGRRQGDRASARSWSSEEPCQGGKSKRLCASQGAEGILEEPSQREGSACKEPSQKGNPAVSTTWRRAEAADGCTGCEAPARPS